VVPQQAFSQLPYAICEGEPTVKAAAMACSYGGICD